jgi:6-pyruvoyltetrahydropterin/6-carboxytetrahydropterin synthase
MIIVKQIEWDMGHRVMNHNSKCKNVHGHRYKIEISLKGDLIAKSGDSSEGMVIDFADIKKIAMEHVHDVLDHGFMVWDKDEILMDLFRNHPDLKHIVVPFTPTAENIAKWVFERLNDKYTDIFKTGLRLNSIRLWETPTGYVICTQDDK